jgi:UDP-apiose/xylose synthase
MGSATASICVLGGGGFLGSHLVEALLRGGEASVTALDTSFAKLEAEAGPRLRLLEADISDPAALADAVGQSDVVLSLTALCNPALYSTQPLEVIDANYTHLVPLIERCAARGQRLIHFSTCEVYGKPYPRPGGDPAPMNEDETPLVLGPVNRERWTYACAKQLLERVIWGHGAHRGLAFSIVRPFNVIGPRMDFIDGIDGSGIPRVLACFMRALLAGEPLALVEGGAQRRAFISVEDFTAAVLRIIERPGPCAGQVINLGNPDNDVSIAELGRALAAVYEARHGGRLRQAIRFEDVSAEAFYGPGYDDTERRIPEIGKARRLLDWAPSTSLDQMLPSIVDDYVARYGAQLDPARKAHASR